MGKGQCFGELALLEHKPRCGCGRGGAPVLVGQSLAAQSGSRPAFRCTSAAPALHQRYACPAQSPAVTPAHRQPLPQHPPTHVPCSAATVRAAADSKVLACTREAFDTHLGSLAEIRNLWRFEALRKVRRRVGGCWWVLAAGRRSVAGHPCNACPCKPSPPSTTALPVPSPLPSPARQVPLLAPLTSQQRLALCSALQVRAVKAGEAVITKGEVGDTFYVIELGTCAVVNDEGVVRVQGEEEGQGVGQGAGQSGGQGMQGG